MTFELLMQDNYKHGKAEGLAEGKAQGLAEGIAEAEAKAKEREIQSVKNFYAQGLSVEAIAKGLNLSKTEVQTIISEK